MNTSSDAVVRERFESVVDTVDDSDWDDVIARAGLVDTSRVSRSAFAFRKRAALVAVFAAFALGVGATLVSGAPFRGGSSTANAPGPGQVQRQVGERDDRLAVPPSAPRRITRRRAHRAAFARGLALAADQVRPRTRPRPGGRREDRRFADRQARPQHLHDRLPRQVGVRRLRDRAAAEAFQRLDRRRPWVRRWAEHDPCRARQRRRRHGCRSSSLTDEADRCRSETTRSSSASRRQTFR